MCRCNVKVFYVNIFHGFISLIHHFIYSQPRSIASCAVLFFGHVLINLSCVLYSSFVCTKATIIISVYVVFIFHVLCTLLNPCVSPHVWFCFTQDCTVKDFKVSPTSKFPIFFSSLQSRVLNLMINCFRCFVRTAHWEILFQKKSKYCGEYF